MPRAKMAADSAGKAAVAAALGIEKPEPAPAPEVENEVGGNSPEPEAVGGSPEVKVEDASSDPEQVSEESPSAPPPGRWVPPDTSWYQRPNEADLLDGLEPEEIPMVRVKLGVQRGGFYNLGGVHVRWPTPRNLIDKAGTTELGHTVATIEVPQVMYECSDGAMKVAQVSNPPLALIPLNAGRNRDQVDAITAHNRRAIYERFSVEDALDTEYMSWEDWRAIA